MKEIGKVYQMEKRRCSKFNTKPARQMYEACKGCKFRKEVFDTPIDAIMEFLNLLPFFNFTICTRCKYNKHAGVELVCFEEEEREIEE